MIMMVMGSVGDDCVSRVRWGYYSDRGGIE